jgi:hypothetical protein
VWLATMQIIPESRLNLAAQPRLLFDPRRIFLSC